VSKNSGTALRGELACSVFCCGFSGEIDTHAELHSLGWSLTYSAIPQAFHSYYFMAIKISKIPFMEVN
jgi:hypothetical protein